MGKLLTCLPRLTLAQLRTLGSTIQGVRATETLQISHRPHGRLTTMLVVTGRRCLCRGGCPGDLLIVHHQWEPSLQRARARSRSKVPIAPMGASRLARCFAGRRCLCQFRQHFLYRQLPSVFQSSYPSACSCSKVPNAFVGCLAFVTSIVTSVFPSPCPGAQCLCLRRHGELLCNDPQRRLCRLWLSHNMLVAAVAIAE